MAISQLWNKYLWEDLGFTTLLFHEYSFFLSIFLLLFTILFLLFIHNKSSHGKLNLPPSPRRLPIIGNLHQLGKFPHRSLRALSEKYGPLMLLNLGQVPTLVVSSPDLVAEIVNTHDVIFSSRPKTTATEVLFYGNNDVAFAPYGEYWRQMRKICVVELLSLKRVQSFQFVREEETEVLLHQVRKACLYGETTINLSQMLSDASNNIISRCILGQSYRAEDGSLSKLGELSKRVMVELIAFSVGDFFPSLKWVDFVRGFLARLGSTFRELDAFNNCLVQEHKTMKIAPNHDGSEIKDFVEVLLRLQEDRKLDFELTQDQLKAILQDLFIAGIETSSTVMEWLMAELLRHPRVMKKAQEEIRRVVGEKEKVDVNDINQMYYLKNVVKETMRLHPPAPLLAPRETTARVQLGGYDIPAKTRVLINAWAIQRHADFWERPDEFIPERFENNPMDLNSQDFKLIPFGFGRRRCPGLAFGISGIEYLIANILYWFDWKLPNDAENMDMTEVCGMSVFKKFPLHVVPIRYSP
ncbi:hypothetical protein TIFTF001_037966 [Ficus carica]|uniref:Cytochrome P450 n=1 Tax=Ficus carica TaxID=3494 RepID=A0AA88J9H9_FICCA|nr:hypothetical protein TIFTF001_037966 [Ficus carica]